MKMGAEIGIFGGSGFYSFLKGKEITMNTRYGKPSDKIMLAEYLGKKIAFLSRHGKKHTIPPHKIPYRANLYAFKKLGVKRIISPCTVGSLKSNIKPGNFVIADQFIDRTKSRDDTYYNGPKVAHISIVQPYCPEMKKSAIAACKKIKAPFHDNGTLVVIQGPRFSSVAESRWFAKIGGDIIGMTHYPEVVLAKELEMCFINISLVTDYDVGLQGKKDIKPVSFEEVKKIFNKNNEKVRNIIFEIIEKMPTTRRCLCNKSLDGA